MNTLPLREKSKRRYASIPAPTSPEYASDSGEGYRTTKDALFNDRYLFEYNFNGDYLVKSFNTLLDESRLERFTLWAVDTDNAFQRVQGFSASHVLNRTREVAQSDVCVTTDEQNTEIVSAVLLRKLEQGYRRKVRRRTART